MEERHVEEGGELTVDRLLTRLVTLEREHAQLQREYARLGAQLRAELECRPRPPAEDRHLGQGLVPEGMVAAPPEAEAHH